MAKRSTKKSARKTGGAASRKSATKSTRGAARKSARGAARKTGGAAARKSGGGSARKGARKGGRTPNAAFMRPVTPSAALSEVVGDQPIPRTEVTKRLWAYIKRRKLQDQNNRRMINADATLKPVLGGKSSVSMFEMTRLVNKHLK